MSPSFSSGFSKRALILLAMGAGGSWLLHQEAGRREWAMKVENLRSLLSAAERGTRSPQGPPAERRSGLDRRPVDWRAVAAQMRDGQPLVGGVLNGSARLLAAIEAKSVEELMEMLDEIAAADLSLIESDALERALAAALARKAPAIAFSRFSVPERRGWDSLLGVLYLKWLEEDATAGVSWLRQRCEGGGFVNRGMVNQPFFKKLGTEPGLSAELLACLPPERRLEFLAGSEVATLQRGGQAEWAQIVRQLMPEQDQSKAIIWPLGCWIWSDVDRPPMTLGQVDAYLEAIQASDRERDACIMKVAEFTSSWGLNDGGKTLGSDALEGMRSWVAGHAPEMVEPATLHTLERMDFTAASEWALKHREGGGGEVYLAAVLERMNRHSDAATVQRMIERLSDPSLQNQYRERQREMRE